MTTRRRTGFALVIALWFIVTLGTSVLELSLAERTLGVAAANALEHEAGTEAAMAGIAEASTRLRSLVSGGDGAALVDPSDPWRHAILLVPDTLRVGGLVVRVTARDAGAYLDLDRVDDEQFFRFLLALRIDAAVARRVADAFADWRDPDQLRRTNGAERADYLRWGAPLVPADGPLEDVAELRGVHGVSDSLFLVIRPFLTVGGTRRVDLATAGRPVLLSLPGFGEEAVARIQWYRAAGAAVPPLDRLATELPGGARQRLTEALPLLRLMTSTSVTDVEIASEAVAPNGRVIARALVVLSRLDGVRTLSTRID